MGPTLAFLDPRTELFFLLLDFFHGLFELIVFKLILAQIERLGHIKLHDFERPLPELGYFPAGVHVLVVLVKAILELLFCDIHWHSSHDDGIVGSTDGIVVVLLRLLELPVPVEEEDEDPNDLSLDLDIERDDQ